MPPIRLSPSIGFPKSIPEALRTAHAPICQFRALQTSPTNHVGRIAPGPGGKSGPQSSWVVKRYNRQRQFWQWNGTRTTHHGRGIPQASSSDGALGILLGVSAVALLASPIVSWAQQQADSIENDEATGPIHDDKGGIRLAEIVKHDREAETKWVIHGTAVYDITAFVESHPGGEVILRACGASIDPYWKLFSIHQKPEVKQVLDQYYIGDIDVCDLDIDGKINWCVLDNETTIPGIDDPFKDEPERDPELIIQTAKPCNAETPGKLLSDFITPLRLFFVRHHLWVPRIESKDHKLTIELSDGEELTYTMDDLKQKFQEHTITATLQCAGNRRSHMSNTTNGKTSGLQWDIGAIGTAEFTGVRLRDVLLDAGYDVNKACETCPNDPDADRHIHFSAPSDTYEQSIPLQTALNPTADVLLAWKMNGEPMPRDHGGPLRAIVPGSVATRSVKWVGKVRLSCEESQSNWHNRDYKCFGPNIRKPTDLTAQDWDEAQSIQEMPVQSAITNIVRAQSDGESPVSVNGFAYSGGGRRIVRVDVSADGGRTWKQARLHKDDAKGSRRWAWTLWSIVWPKDQLPVDQTAEFVVKAVDEGYNTQPQTFDATWNFRGLLGNAWHRVPLSS